MMRKGLMAILLLLLFAPPGRAEEEEVRVESVTVVYGEAEIASVDVDQVATSTANSFRNVRNVTLAVTTLVILGVAAAAVAASGASH